MNDLLGDRLTETLAERAASVDTAPRRSVEEVIGRARRVRCHRRATAAAAAAVLAFSVGAVALQVSRGVGRAVARPAATSSPTPIRPAPSGSVMQDLGFDLTDAGHGRLITADQTEVHLQFRYPQTIGAATRVPGGWVVEAATGDGVPALLFVTPDGNARVIAVYDRSGSYAVSPDGHTLVVSQVYGDQGTGTPITIAVVFDLPSLQRVAALTGPTDTWANVEVKGVFGNLALLTADGGFVTGVWDYPHTSIPTLVLNVQNALAMSDGGAVLYVPATNLGPGTCLSVLPLAQLQLGGAPETCVPEFVDSAAMSPDGSVAFVQGAGMFAVAGLVAGDARPVPLAPGFAHYGQGHGHGRAWTADDRIALERIVDDKPVYTWAVCGVDGRCTPAPGPDDVDSPVPAANRGA
jgi:hypothetical protein